MLVFDCGSGESRVGRAGDEIPTRRRRKWDFSAPYAMDALWEDSMAGAPGPCEHALWLDDVGPKSSRREELSQLLFEKHGLKSLFFLECAPASLYSMAQTSGVVVDCGASASRCCVVTEGYVVPPTRDFEPMLGGWEIDNRLAKLAELQGSSFEDVRSMREAIGDVALEKDKEIELYHLPDGTKISSMEVCPVVENTFFPPTGESRSLTTLVHSSVSNLKAADDRRKIMWSTLAVGNLSKTPSLPDRLEYELDLCVPKSSSQRPRVTRSGNAWLGGSIFASLPGVRAEAFVTRSEYAERGGYEAVLDKACDTTATV